MISGVSRDGADPRARTTGRAAVAAAQRRLTYWPFVASGKPNHGVAVQRLPSIAAAMMVAPLALLASLAQTADAQILRVPKGGTGEPALWANAAIGLVQMQRVNDGTTEAQWAFGSALQYRGSLEYTVARGNTVGVSATYARVPLTYRSFSDAGTPLPGGGICLDCDAKADVTTIFGTFHGGGGAGFHQVIEIAGGAIMYRNFRTDDGGEELPPAKDTDFAFAFGYGFGYTLNRTVQLNLVQDAVLTLHQREGLSGDNSSVSQQYVTRLGVRLGVGSRRGL